MNLYFSDNFDTDTVNTLPAWFTNVASSTWAVVNNATPFTSPNSLTSTSVVDGDKVLLLGGSGVTIPATADLILTGVTKTYLNNLPQNGIQYIIRSDSAGQNYYVFLMEKASTGSNIAFQLFKSVGGSLTTIGGITDSGYAFPGVGIALHVKVAAIGTTISAKVWQDGTLEPASYQVNITDSSITAAGYAGFYYAGTTPGFSIDNVQVFGNSTLAAGTLTASNVQSTSLTVTSTAATGGTGPYSYHWYRSTISGFVPQTSTLLAGQTSLTLNDSGLSPSSTYFYMLIATDSTGAIAWSSALSVTTAAGVATDFNVNPSSQATAPGTPTANYTVTLNGPLTVNENIALSDAAAGGTFSPTSLTFTSANAGTPQTFTYTPALGTGGTTKTLTATGTGAFSATHSVSCVVTLPLTPGTAFSTYIKATQAQLSATDATGGSGSYTFQWFRSNSSGTTGSPISGATSESLIDTGLTSATLYYYSLQYTDTSTGATGLTAQVAVTTSAGNTQEVVGGIGDSIMAGSFSTFETPFNAMLDQLNYKISTSQFTGVNRAISGTTSTDWASTTAGSALLNAVAAFVSAGVTRIVLMLGTNDSKASVATAPNAYQSNIQTIVNYVFAHVPSLKTVHMFSSPFQSLTSGDLSIQNCGRLIAYANTLASIANGTTVFYSEPLASYNLFQNDPSLLRDGIHPTDLGDQTMGGLWGSNVASDLGSGATTAAGYSRSRVVNGG